MYVYVLEAPLVISCFSSHLTLLLFFESWPAASSLFEYTRSSMSVYMLEAPLVILCFHSCLVLLLDFEELACGQLLVLMSKVLYVCVKAWGSSGHLMLVFSSHPSLVF